MLDITYEYTCKYRYVLNASKSFVIVFGDNSRSQQNTLFHIGPENIQHTQTTKHVGVLLNSKLSDKDKIEKACSKAKASFFSLLSVCLHPSYINPMAAASLVHKVCIPTLLFGAELWNKLTNSDCMKLERFLRMAAKKIQSFPIRTRTDICVSMIGWKNIQSEIDYRKLTFLGNLCRLPITSLTRKVFNARVSLFVCRTDSCQRGYIPDIATILAKYNMSHILISYVQSGSFPSKYAWSKNV